MLSPALILSCIGAYFAILLGIAWVTSRRAGNAAYFLGNRASPWYIVAFGLIADSLSGVTFISVPGRVRDAQFGYLQVVLGYAAGYVVIAHVLLPLYYRLQLTSIYTYLGHRFGSSAQKTGSAFFLLSRLLGAAARLYLAAGVAQHFLFNQWGIPFWVSVTAIIALILVYTYRGGIKTLVWTDGFQSLFLLAGLVISIVMVASDLGLGPRELYATIRESPYSRVFVWEWAPAGNFWKEFIGGAFIAICMTGLDQNMMQKNLSCRSLSAAQLNLHCFSVIVVIVNVLFLALGALLYTYATARNIEVPARTDLLFPTLSLEHLGGLTAIVFLLGLTAATFSSADSVLTTLTTSFYVDILRLEERRDVSDALRVRVRHVLHLTFAVLLLLSILAFQLTANEAVIATVLRVAGYTYGPLLGLFAFGLLTRRRVSSKAIPLAAIAAPVICGLLDAGSVAWFNGYRFGNELLLVNGLLTFLGLWLASRPQEQ